MAGNQSFASYGYQIDVSIWLGLELMLAKGQANEIEIEPPSHEDVEASLRDPSNASLDVQTGIGATHLIVQIKSRTTAPWSSTDFAEILLGEREGRKKNGKRKARGPAPRPRPLTMLTADPTAKYLFVTNEATEAGLRAHHNTDVDILSFPDPGDLPPYCRQGRLAAVRSGLGKRIGICADVSRELLQSRIFKLLDKHGNVPPQKHPRCFEVMRAEVSARLEGQFDGRWTLSDLMDVIISHGGARLAHRRHDQFVPPRSFADIEEFLEAAHAVIIVGPSGTGKSLSADFLAAGLARQSPAFLETFPQTASEARSALTEAGPLLIHLRDPWGASTTSPEAGRWTAELPILFNMAGPAHKFLVTTRSDIFKQSQPSLALLSYTVAIEATDYSRSQRERIYDNHVSDLSGHAHTLALAYRDTALRQIQRPYQIERFIAALPRELEESSRPVTQILDESAIEAISSVIRDQVRGWGDDGIACGAILWGLLTASSSFAKSDLQRVLRALRTDHHRTPHVEGLIDFLEAGRNLRIEHDFVRLSHPRVAQGLQLALTTNRAETESVLTDLTDVLIDLGAGRDNWASQIAVGILRVSEALEAVEIQISPAAQERIERALIARLTSPSGGKSAELAFVDLSRFAREESGPRRFAKLLLTLSRPDKGGFFQATWIPPVLTADELAQYQADPASASLVEAFIRAVLPFANGTYRHDFIDFARQFSANLGPAFDEAVAALAKLEQPGDNIATIIRGALIPGGPGYDALIDAFIAAESEADRWFELEAAEQRRAREHEVDAIHASHILEEPSERYYNATEGLKAVTLLRFAAEGWEWLEGHPNSAAIARALASGQRDQKQAYPLDYLQTLLRHADDRGLPAVWSLVERNWAPGLLPDLESALVRSDIDNGEWRKTLAHMACCCVEAGVNWLVDGLRPRLSPARAMELILDLERAEEIDAARQLADALPPCDTEIAHMLLDLENGTQLESFMTGRSVEVRTRIAELCAESPNSVTRILIRLAAFGEGPILRTAERLLATGDDDEGLPAVLALMTRNGLDERVLIHEALAHPRYPVRRAAMQYLVRTVAAGDRHKLLAMATDPSADIRLAWAELMMDHRWPEAECLLAKLVEDDRDFSLDHYHGTGQSWPRYSVARAAVRALGAFEGLSNESVDALLAARQSEDPFVYCAALVALSTHDDDRVAAALHTALSASGLKGDSEYRVLSQAAIRAYSYRAAAGLVFRNDDVVALEAIAQTDQPLYAGLALVALGFAGGASREGLYKGLTSRGQSERAELLMLSALIAERPFGQHAQAAQIGARLAQLRDGTLAPDPGLLSWYNGLIGHDVADQTVWLVARFLNLEPMSHAKDPRTFCIPRTIPVMTMYSMTPYREEVEGPDDGS